MSELTYSISEQLRDLWRDHIAYANGGENAPAEYPAATLDDGLYDWAYVDSLVGSKEKTRKHALYYSKGAKAGQPVKLKLYGVVKKSALKTLGDWKGQESFAHKARVSLDLKGLDPPHDKPFKDQVEFVKLLRDFVTSELDATESNSDKREWLYLQHRVFCLKHRQGKDITHPIGPGDDPDGHAERVCHKWILAPKVEFKRLKNDGRPMKCSHSAIGVGDFVQAQVGVDIVTVDSDDNSTRKGGRSDGVSKRVVHVHLELEEVVRLKSAEQMETLKSEANKMNVGVE